MNKESNQKCGIVSLHDSEMNQVAYRLYDRKAHRQEIIKYWERLYKLNNKTYYILISPKQN
jgi:hypothetical protein